MGKWPQIRAEVSASLGVYSPKSSVFGSLQRSMALNSSLPVSVPQLHLVLHHSAKPCDTHIMHLNVDLEFKC